MSLLKKSILAGFILLFALNVAAQVKFTGLDPADMDPTTSAGQDFYQYAGGGWMKANPLSAEYSSYGVYDELNEKNRSQLQQLFDNLAAQEQQQGSIGQKVIDLYKLAMDSVCLNNEGVNPLKQDLLAINQMDTKDLDDFLAYIHQYMSNSPFFVIGVEPDLMNSDLNVMYLSAGTSGLPDRDYYLKTDAESKKIQEKYKECLQKLFVTCGYSSKEAKRAAKTIYDIEYAFAEAKMSRAEARDYTKLYNIRTVEQLQKDYPAMNWSNYFNKMDVKVSQVILTEPKVMAVANRLLQELTSQQMKDYICGVMIRGAANLLSDDIAETAFDFYGRTLSGQQQRQPRWKRAQRLPNNILGEAVGQLYVEKFFPLKSKAKILKLVNNLRMSLAEHIAGLTWMSDSTKINSLVKLNAFSVKVGYPDKWREYPFEIDPKKSLYENIKVASQYENQRNLKKNGQPVDKEEWAMTPQTINAYYNPQANEIVFPAAILQAPFFDPDVDDAVNYGAIGVVIGHEMTHGFDDQGSMFDPDGNMRNWWNAQDKARFHEAAEKLAAQFDQIVVVKDEHANGHLTLGENIADQGGLRIAFDAFKKTDEGKRSDKIGGFTPEQRFYLSYGRIWAENITDEAAYQQTKSDPHSLGRWRVNATLRNIDTFFKAFDIKQGDKMFLPENERVVIW